MRSTQAKGKRRYDLEQPPLMKTHTAIRTYNEELRPTPSMRLPSSKELKKQFIIADHMTQSRIMEARVGLQLLKKKSRVGDRQSIDRRESMRESVKDGNNEERNNKDNAKKANNVPIKDSKERQKLGQTAYRENQKKEEGYSQKEIPAGRSKINVKRIENSYKNQLEEIPIAPKKDFYALLEQQMQKQNKNSKNNVKNNTKKVISAEQNDFIQCSRGCGRMFNPLAIEKHQKICEKVFQSKRKTFNSAAFRAPQNAQMSAPNGKDMKKTALRETIIKESNKPNKDKMPKWKIQSLQWRAGLNGGKKMTQEEKQIIQDNSDTIQCKYCMRKFSQAAGKRHIPFCQTKSKQMPKLNTSIKKK